MLVVDDDEAVRAGLQALLEAWWAMVTAFGDEASLSRWLEGPVTATSPAAADAGLVSAVCAAAMPDIVVVDHRLATPGDGLRALQRLRRAWPEPIVPAILVTGSLLEDQEDLRRVPALHVLRKPVAPLRVRALLASLRGVADAGPAAAHGP